MFCCCSFFLSLSILGSSMPHAYFWRLRIWFDCSMVWQLVEFWHVLRFRKTSQQQQQQLLQQHHTTINNTLKWRHTSLYKVLFGLFHLIDTQYRGWNWNFFLLRKRWIDSRRQRNKKRIILFRQIFNSCSVHFKWQVINWVSFFFLTDDHFKIFFLCEFDDIAFNFHRFLNLKRWYRWWLKRRVKFAVFLIQMIWIMVNGKRQTNVQYIIFVR